MTVYLVTQEGVYRHDIRGVYSTQAKAEAAARRAAEEDEDDYHTYEIHTAEIDAYVGDVPIADGAPVFAQRRAAWLPQRFSVYHECSPDGPMCTYVDPKRSPKP